MKVVQVKHAAGVCPVYIGHGLLSLSSLWDRHLPDRVLLVTDEQVGAHYLDKVKPLLAHYAHAVHIMPAGETHKTLATWQAILERLAGMRAGRDATVIALGGGVVGDVAGFAAATWMRGIRFVQMPTTLLAQVDSSVGGKTGVNLPAGKNLIGAFHPAQAVIADLDTLATLPQREYRAGLAEVVKYGAMHDGGFFAWLEQQAGALRARLPDALLEAVFRSVQAKAAVVAEDEHEAGRRALLNFGHTFAHALEAATAYERWLHGEAVAIGMVLAARLGETLGLTPLGLADRIRALLQQLELPVTVPAGLESDKLLSFMRLDKKSRADQLRLVLLEDIGRARVETQCPLDDIRAVLAG